MQPYTFGDSDTDGLAFMGAILSATERRRGPVPVQSVPERWSDERMHVLDESCWCHPEVIEVPPAIHHRRES